MSELADKVAIVTGASSGIGAATARRLLDAGARVVLFARRAEELNAVAEGSGDRALVVAGDISDERAVADLFDQCEKRFGPCDVLVNSAGSIDPGPLVETSRSRWDEMFAVNVTGPFLTSRRALPQMIARRSGVIINVASISGVVGTQKFAGFVSYAAAKAAVIGMTEALAAEVKEFGVRVNAVSPGSVDTAMLKRANPSLTPDMTADEIAEAILFLIAARPINGQNIHVYSA